MFLSCLPWGYKQINEFGTETATLGSSSFALKVNCGGKSQGSPKKEKQKCSLHQQLCFTLPLSMAPCMDKAAEKPVDITFGEIDKAEAVCCR